MGPDAKDAVSTTAAQPESRPNARGDDSAGSTARLRRNDSYLVTNPILEWRVLACRGGQGMVAKVFTGCFAEDGVILLLPLVRLRFAVKPAQWIDWTFVAIPRFATAADRVVIFQINSAGLPMDTDVLSRKCVSRPALPTLSDSNHFSSTT